MIMKTPLLPVVVIVFLMNCTTPAPGPSSFVATLGEDTLVVEQFTITPESVEAEVLIRTPRTRYIKHSLRFTPEGAFGGFTSTTYDPSALDGEPVQIVEVALEGDSLVSTMRREGEEHRGMMAYDPKVLPWVDMVHWPYDVALRRMAKAGSESVDQLMLAGRRPAVFEIRAIGTDSVSIKHPFRGTMYARIDEHGGIVNYDATTTTRKLIVRRAGNVDIQALASVYADRPIGSLSGAGSSSSAVHGATIEITFGQPARRGRELFGGIVPWNERWRTGANRATHFKTDKDLRFGELEMPAGEYTLFSIPAPDGGTLIINQQTGQNGNRYDEAQDLGRVPMTITQNKESVELFSIEASEREASGVLQLIWGETIFEVPFEVIE